MNFARESVASVWNELLGLARAHHAEQDFRWPFNPKRKFYESVELAGLLWLFTLRTDVAGDLLGYQAFMIMHHPHYDCRIASQDTIYVSPAYRGFAAGRFLRWADKQLVEAGAQKIIRLVPRAHDWSASIEKLGYEPGDKILVRSVNG